MVGIFGKVADRQGNRRLFILRSNMLKKILFSVFPFVHSHIANKKLRVEQDKFENQLSKIKNSDAISIDIIEQKYTDSIATKDKLESKAKSNIFAVTISITLILGASSLLNNVYIKLPYTSIYWSSFILFVLVVIYMIIAGVTSIRILVDENKIYTISLETYAEEGIDLREDYDTCTVANVNQNLIRNNGINASYACIRNSLICLFAIAVMIVFPYAANSSTQGLNTQSRNGYSIVYSSDAVNYITQNNDQTVVEALVINAVNKGDINSSTPVGIISGSDKLFIKANIVNKTITIFLVEGYEILN